MKLSSEIWSWASPTDKLLPCYIWCSWGPESDPQKASSLLVISDVSKPLKLWSYQVWTSTKFNAWLTLPPRNSEKLSAIDIMKIFQMMSPIIKVKRPPLLHRSSFNSDKFITTRGRDTQVFILTTATENRIIIVKAESSNSKGSYYSLSNINTFI